MIEAIVEVWCSPLRQEDYSIKIIPLCAGDLFNVEDEIRDYINWDFYLNTFGVDYLEVKGLWKVDEYFSKPWKKHLGLHQETNILQIG